MSEIFPFKIFWILKKPLDVKKLLILNDKSSKWNPLKVFFWFPFNELRYLFAWSAVFIHTAAKETIFEISLHANRAQAKIGCYKSDQVISASGTDNRDDTSYKKNKYDFISEKIW